MMEAVAKVARNGHLTIPSKIRKYLHIEDGDIVRFSVTDHKIILIPAAVVDKDQEYFFTEPCQKEVRKAEEDFKKGKYSTYTSSEQLRKEIEGD